jgi:hypothetical protein
MGEAVKGAGQKVLALAILLAAAYVLLKLVIGLVWVVIAVLAVVAIIWALRVL